MRRSRLWADESGSASLEFIVTGLLLLVPLVYLVLAVSAVQGASLAVEGAARQASRVFVQAGSISEAQAAASRAIEVTLADYGLDSAEVAVAIQCQPVPTACLTRRGFVTVTVETTVALPLVPSVLDLDLPAGVPVRAASTEQVSRFAGAR
jgi:Flp pilus assembly protein TadG